MKSMLAFLPLFARIRWQLLTTLILSLVTLAAGIGLLGVSGWFLTAAALSTAGAAFNLFGPSAGVRGLSFLRILSRYGEKLSGHDATLRLLSDLRRWLFQRLFPLVPLARRFGRADLVSRLLGDVDALDTMFLVALGPISTAVLAGFGMSLLLAVFLPGAALIYAGSFAAAAVLVPMVLVTVSRRRAGELARAASRLRQTVLDGIEGHQDLVLFGETGTARREIGEAAAELAALRARLGLFAALASGAVQLAMGAALLGTLAAGVEALSRNAIDGPLLAGLLLAVIASFEASAVLVRSAARLANAAAAAERLESITQATPAAGRPTVAKSLPAGGRVAFEAVSFGYRAMSDVLDHVSFDIETGECVAIKGPSGAGKSTIAQLLVRLDAPRSGTISVNGCDIAKVDAAELQQRVALMTQDAPVFLDTVRENLRIARPSASDAELWEVLETTGLAPVIKALPGGLNAVLGEAGKTLSAGQARRICLARTLLSPASIIILDEPTSGLDRESEIAFLTDLPATADGRTMIVITHADVPATFSRVLTLRAGSISAA